MPAASLEQDLYLTRLLWALGDRFGDQLALKGGTCLMKVDVGFRRMSADIDLVIPCDGSLSHKGINASHTNRVRDALRELGPMVGDQLETPDGEVWEKRSHIKWTVRYPSEFGRAYSGQTEPTETIDVEVAMRPVLLPVRRAALQTAVTDEALGDYSNAYCFALHFAEVRAEKVRAAFTREEPQIRDYSDLGLLRHAEPHWAERYGCTWDDDRLPTNQTERHELVAAVGADGLALLHAVYSCGGPAEHRWKSLKQLGGVAIMGSNKPILR